MKISKVEYIVVPDHITPLLPKDFINLPLKSILYNDYDSTFVKFEELDRNPYTLNNSDSACFDTNKYDSVSNTWTRIPHPDYLSGTIIPFRSVFFRTVLNSSGNFVKKGALKGTSVTNLANRRFYYVDNVFLKTYLNPINNWLKNVSSFKTANDGYNPGTNVPLSQPTVNTQ